MLGINEGDAADFYVDSFGQCMAARKKLFDKDQHTLCCCCRVPGMLLTEQLRFSA